MKLSTLFLVIHLAGQITPYFFSECINKGSCEKLPRSLLCADIATTKALMEKDKSKQLDVYMKTFNGCIGWYGYAEIF